MIIKILIFVTAFVLVSSEEQFGISSSFLHISTPPKQVAFNNLGEYSGRTYKNIGYKKTYYVSKFFRATWVDAKTICKAFDLELATFETSDEASHFINRQSVKNFFDDFDHHFVVVDGVGLTPKSPTDWYWTNSGEKIPYTMQWIAGEPNYHQNYEYCLSLGKISKNEKIGFNDFKCWDYPTNFICQKTEMTA